MTFRHRTGRQRRRLRAAWRRGEIDDWQNPDNKSPRQRELEAVAEEFRAAFGDARLEREGDEIRKIGICSDPAPLTEYDESYPYMIAYYDLPDMPTMSG